VKLWAVYSDQHTEVDISGDRDGLRALAAAVAQDESMELALGDPPPEWQETEPPIEGNQRDAWALRRRAYLLQT
jgi:hypothetical protein